MNRTAVINTLKIVVFAMIFSTFINLMLMFAPNVLLGLVLAGMMAFAVKMVYTVERDRAEILKRIDSIR